MKIAVLVFLFVWSFSVRISAQDFGESDLPEGNHQVFSFDYMESVKTDRSIKSYHLSSAFGKYITPDFALYGQLTMAKNTGFSTHWQTGTPVNHRASTQGVGLSLLARFDFARTDDFNLTANASAGVIYFNKPFPAYGTRLNALLKAGLSAGYRISGPWHAELGVRYMHISNAKGNGGNNPSLDSVGPSLSLSRQF